MEHPQPSTEPKREEGERCGRCLILVPSHTFLHDCAGLGLEPTYYVERLEAGIEELTASVEHTLSLYEASFDKREAEVNKRVDLIEQVEALRSRERQYTCHCPICHAGLGELCDVDEHVVLDSRG